MPRAATAFVDFKGDFSQIHSQVAGESKKVESGFSRTFKNVAKGAAISLATVGITKIVGDSLSAARESAKIARLTDSVVKSTGGAAGISSKQVGALADNLSKMAGVDDELIQSGENVLLTFTKVRNEAGKGNDIFDQGALAALNMSRALGTDLQGSVIQVGKALNDPIKGVTALQRVGVSFTAAQKKQIKTLVDSGKTLEAQKLILHELGTEFGGAAKAAAEPTDKLKVSVENLQESAGKLLLPVINQLATAFSSLATFLTENQTAAAALGIVLASIGAGMLANKVATLASAAATTVATAAQKLFGTAVLETDAALAANPIGLVVGALVLLGAAVFLAYKKFGPFHDAVDAVWQVLQSTFRWVQANWPLLLAILTGPFGLATRFIIQNWTAILGFFKAIPGALGGFLKDVATTVTAPFRTAFNEIARLWNNTIGKLHFKIPGWVPGIGGKGFDVPDIPTFHSGGVADFGSAGEGIALLRNGERVLTPGQSGGMQIHTTVDGSRFDRALQQMFDDHDRQLAQAISVGAR